MVVRIRMKKMGRSHRHFFRICAMDKRSPRDGKVLEELGTYDPAISDVDARAQLKTDRVDYWLSVGAQPSEKCAVLIKKYGTDGTHQEAQRAALERMAMPVELPDPGAPASLPKSKEEENAEEKSTEENKSEGAAEGEAPAGESAEAPAEGAAAEAPAEEVPAEEEKSE